MPKTPNDKLGNKSFATKKPELEASQFVLTQEIGANATWTPAQIRERQTRLAALAISAWAK